jgi:hypothetical protein
MQKRVLMAQLGFFDLDNCCDSIIKLSDSLEVLVQSIL